MSELDDAEFHRWQRHAHRALDTARLAANGERYEWACFLAEQAAQLSVKGLLHGIGEEAWGHDLTVLEHRAASLLSPHWPDAPDAADAAARLTRHYIPTRYPDAHPGAHVDAHYRRSDADAAIADAERLIDNAARAWAALGGTVGGEEV
ncbi:HEPN domain-containing protein [Egibacter rhizosphaerae]|nr:HEPN domain-containing protein [Egibacter rhizosphaerae]